MNISIRNDSVLITGYVNAVERSSRLIRDNIGGKMRSFVERIRSGAFNKALRRAREVPVLLNHDFNRVLASTSDNSAKLFEDNIGLRAEILITDLEVVEKAQKGQLSGWSFGFAANSEEWDSEGANDLRTVTDMDLFEVSILDNTRTPAYYGTSIESREEGGKRMEIREEAFAKNDIDIDALAEAVAGKVVDAVAEKVISAISASRTENEKEPSETSEDNPNVDETTEEESEEKEVENRNIDYSDFRSRISKI